MNFMLDDLKLRERIYIIEPLLSKNKEFKSPGIVRLEDIL